MEIFLVILFGILGFVPFLLVWIKHNRVKKLKQTGIAVTGVIEDIIATRGYKGVTNFQVIVQYYTPERGTIRSGFTYSYSGKRALYTRRQSIELYYDKNNPQRFTTKHGNTYTAALVITAIMAAAFLVLCYFLLNYLTTPLG